MSQVFISYKREQRSTARGIAAAIAAAGYTVWWDIDLLPGDRFADEIQEVIKKAEAVVVLWSAAAVKSHFVRAEASLALRLNLLIPVRLDNCDLPLPFGEHHTLDLSSWDGSPKDPLLTPLITAISRRVKPSAPSDAEPQADHAQELHTTEEIRDWKALLEQANVGASEYRSHVEKYGIDGLFSELALRRVAEIEATLRRKRTWARTWWVSGVIGGVVLLGVATVIYSRRVGPEPGPSSASETTSARLWRFDNAERKEIPVCWEADPATFADEVSWVQEAVNLSWGRDSPVAFVGWKQCRADSAGVRISVQDGAPHAKALGYQLSGVKDGLVLNFSFNDWSPECKRKRETCIRAMAVHEFGHVLGLPHEHARSDAPENCRKLVRNQEEYPTELLTDPYDPDSVMNYCNGIFANHGILSVLDRKRLVHLYGPQKPRT